MTSGPVRTGRRRDHAPGPDPTAADFDELPTRPVQFKEPTMAASTIVEIAVAAVAVIAILIALGVVARRERTEHRRVQAGEIRDAAAFIGALVRVGQQVEHVGHTEQHLNRKPLRDNASERNLGQRTQSVSSTAPAQQGSRVVKTITWVPKSVRVMTVVAVAAASVAACGSSSTQSPSSPSVSSSSPPSTVAAGSPISVPLTSQPSGTVSLSWDPQSKNVTAKLEMSGFTPGSSHAMHIHQGSCQAQGNVLVPFPDITADDKGAIKTTVTSSQPYASGLAPGTLLNIHLAPSDQMGSPDSLGYTPISCADITPAASTTLTMAPLPGPGEHPQGSATLTYDPAKKTLSVAATTSGLIPGSAHAIHVHLGTCDSQGPVKYPLNDLVASSTGTADSTTVIQDVDQAPPASGWYINVHLGSMSQIQQNGQPTLYFQPIICGNVGK
jgi:hypothetical protein